MASRRARRYKYRWEEDDDTVTIEVPCADGCGTRDVRADFAARGVSLSVKGVEILTPADRLLHAIRPSDCVWSLSGGGGDRVISVTLFKAAPGKTWGVLLEGEDGPKLPAPGVPSIGKVYDRQQQLRGDAAGEHGSSGTPPRAAAWTRLLPSLQVSVMLAVTAVVFTQGGPPLYGHALVSDPQRPGSQLLAWIRGLDWRFDNWREGVSVPAHRVGNRLWVGDLAAAADSVFLSQVNVTHVVAVTQFGSAARYYPTLVRYHVIPVRDKPVAPLGDYLTPAVEFIRAALKSGGTVLIHSHFGLSRAPTVAAAYLVRTQRVSAEDALDLVEMNRPGTDPNQGFVKQLRAFAAQSAQRGS
eukprot:TRINITY_DN21670_c0_g2_i1.p1 TRINITY_DN21670_c0_g2~~TRINITY_DN21670_c0_g2_i1.p1  ORF type:complete len:356 (+),score=87.04 TRINITY_DN21670_c0_g2_i1:115-1182(+)